MGCGGSKGAAATETTRTAVAKEEATRPGPLEPPAVLDVGSCVPMHRDSAERVVVLLLGTLEKHWKMVVFDEKDVVAGGVASGKGATIRRLQQTLDFELVSAEALLGAWARAHTDMTFTSTRDMMSRLEQRPDITWV